MSAPMQTGRSHHLNGPTKVKSRGANVATGGTRMATSATAAATSTSAVNSSDNGSGGANANNMKSSSILNDFKTKTVLKEAVDAVVSSFAKHTQGYGRGKKKTHFVQSAIK